MRNFLLVAASIFLAGCADLKAAVQAVAQTQAQPQAQAQAQPQAQTGAQSRALPVDEVVANNCYTVDLFTKVKVQKPGADVPIAFQEFLGEWGGGAWNGVWCHGLLVSKVYADGRADLIDMHAPYEPWAQPATAFRRVGRIDDDGVLRFSYGTTRLSYRIENGRMYGTNNGLRGNLKVTLVRRGKSPVRNLARRVVSPIPAPNPVRLSQLGLAAKSGG